MAKTIAIVHRTINQLSRLDLPPGHTNATKNAVKAATSTTPTARRITDPLPSACPKRASLHRCLNHPRPRRLFSEQLAHREHAFIGFDDFGSGLASQFGVNPADGRPIEGL
jgi:hypothetical protein